MTDKIKESPELAVTLKSLLVHHTRDEISDQLGKLLTVEPPINLTKYETILTAEGLKSLQLWAKPEKLKNDTDRTVRLFILSALRQTGQELGFHELQIQQEDKADRELGILIDWDTGNRGTIKVNLNSSMPEIYFPCEKNSMPHFFGKIWMQIRRALTAYGLKQEPKLFCDKEEVEILPMEFMEGYIDFLENREVYRYDDNPPRYLHAAVALNEPR